MNVGTIKQIIGPVVDVSFTGENSKVPDILNALEITRTSGEKVILEVQQHLGEDSVRAVAMDSTDGLMRGMDVVWSYFQADQLRDKFQGTRAVARALQ